MRRKEKDIPERADWMADLAFVAVDVTVLTNELNTKLQGKGLFAHVHSLAKAFMGTLQFGQIEGNLLTHMLTLTEATPSLITFTGIHPY